MSIKERLRGMWNATSSPHQIALGFTVGLTLSMIPIPVVGMLAGIGLAGLLRANLVSAYLGTAVMNPVTGPVIFFAELWLGLTIMRMPVPAWADVRHFSASQWFAMLRELAGPFGLGIAAFMVASVVIGYPLSFALAKVLKKRFHRETMTAQVPPSASNGTSSGS